MDSHTCELVPTKTHPLAASPAPSRHSMQGGNLLPRTQESAVSVQTQQPQKPAAPPNPKPILTRVNHLTFARANLSSPFSFRSAAYFPIHSYFLSRGSPSPRTSHPNVGPPSGTQQRRGPPEVGPVKIIFSDSLRTTLQDLITRSAAIRTFDSSLMVQIQGRSMPIKIQGKVEPIWVRWQALIINHDGRGIVAGASSYTPHAFGACGISHQNPILSSLGCSHTLASSKHSFHLIYIYIVFVT